MKITKLESLEKLGKNQSFREMQIKTIMRYHFILTGMAKVKRFTMPSFMASEEKQEPRLRCL